MNTSNTELSLFFLVRKKKKDFNLILNNFITLLHKLKACTNNVT